jgi:hypothetical protein
MKMALTNFLQSPSASGLNVGLGYFPIDGDQCNVPGYATPAVPIAALPGVATPILSSINMTQPNMETPTLPALTGVVQYAQQREMMTGRRTAIALATDGQPNVCDSSIQAVSAVATMAASAGVYTFVIGVGPSLQNLNAIALAGGTKMAYQVEMATPDQLAAAFKAVQLQASKLACSFTIPPPPAGQTLDPEKVNVRFTPTANPAGGFDVGRVAGRDACGMQGGWYYDNAMNPRTVNLCDTTCAKLNDSGEGSVSVLFGCKGIIIQ